MFQRSWFERIGAATALLVKATRIHYAFAPMSSRRCYESYNEDSKVVQEMIEIIPDLQGDISKNDKKEVPYLDGNDKVLACAKHFVGDAGTTKGINENSTVAKLHELLSIQMPGYLSQSSNVFLLLWFLTPAGMVLKCTPITISSPIPLKAPCDLGFVQGFVISDWEGLDKITSPSHANCTYSVLQSVLAGVDMIMVSFDHIEFIIILTSLVNTTLFQRVELMMLLGGFLE
ncbi:hypothetical protein M9H77_19179 [Catharanthus roseus]|uniref:Uncharacterized protein n=1 Tax=Catharanthus roseus TaxID=4058 RepID=A0ACC0B9K3_CATRO|nr:hypothetical protein M9H77_19179 [Catharanthus roseus]